MKTILHALLLALTLVSTLVSALVLASPPARAQALTQARSQAPAQAGPANADQILQARMMALAEQLRCPVCQNQTIADSGAPLARDMRERILEMMKAGQTDQQIQQFLQDRYGDFVLYRPPFKLATFLLWWGPALLLALGMLVLWRSGAGRHACSTIATPPEELA